MNNKITNNKITKNEKIAKRSKFAKKAILFMVVSMIIMTVTAVTAFAAGGGGQVDTKDFIHNTIIVLRSLVSLIGAGLGIWGVVNLIEGYSGDNAAAKSQGIKQLMAGLALILVGIFVVPILEDMMTQAGA